MQENKIQIWCRRAGPNYLEAKDWTRAMRLLLDAIGCHWIPGFRGVSSRAGPEETEDCEPKTWTGRQGPDVWNIFA